MPAKRKLLIPALAATLIIGIAAYSFLSRVTLDITSLAPRIMAEAQAKLGYKLSVDSLQVKLLPSPNITITGLSASGDAATTLTARIVRLRLALLPLLARRAVVRYIDAEDVSLDITTSGVERLVKSGHGHGPSIDNLDIRGLKINLTDDSSPGGRTIEADINKAYVNRLDNDFVIRVEGRTKHGARFSSTGNWEAAKAAITGKVAIRGIDLEKLSRYLGLKKTASLRGAADADLSYSVIGPKTELDGAVVLTGVEAQMPGVLNRLLRLDGSARVAAAIDGKNYKLSLDDIRLDLGGFILSGAIDAAGSGGNAAFNVSASTTPIALAALKEITPEKLIPAVFAPKFARIGSLTGTAAFEEIRAAGRLKDWRLDDRSLTDKLRVSIKLDRAGLRYPGLSESFREVSGTVSFKDMTITAHDIAARYGGIRLLNLSAVISGLAARPHYEVSLKGIFDAAECARLASELGENVTGFASSLAKVKLSGDVNLSLNLKGELGGKGAPVYSGSARLRDIKAIAADSSSVLGPARGAVSFDNERVTINSLSAVIGDSNLDITGFVEGYVSKTPAFEISASASLTNDTIKRYIWERAPSFSDRLNVKARAQGQLDGFSVDASVDTGAGRAGEKKGIGISNGRFRADSVHVRSGAPVEAGSLEVNIPDGQIYGHAFKDLSASGNVTKDLADGKLRFIIDGGEATASARYYRDKSAIKSFDTDINLNGVMLDEIIASFGVQSKVISGPVYGKAALSGTRGAKGFVSGLNGSISLHADKGRLYKFLILSRIFSIINIISIDELFKEGLPFKTVAGDFTVTDGALATERLYLDSDSMRMSALGKIDLNVPDIESFLAVRPFVTLDKIISSVPLAGWVITGKEQSVVSFYYEISGPLADPDVSPAPIKGIETGITGILERLVAPADNIPDKK
ncbi:MAG: AsmA-like C-terminal domain-containing protein [Deltaproteobacteria bacterium]|nr:AsmA-like C-terminal domain-containing protein [Deltaproteobacteria bacterium]